MINHHLLMTREVAGCGQPLGRGIVETTEAGGPRSFDAGEKITQGHILTATN